VSSLHFAAQRGHDNLCELLLKSGAKVNAMAGDNETPLHWIARATALPKQSVERVIQVLHEEGASLLAVNSRGETPLFVAASAGNFAALRALIKLGALVTAGCQTVRAV
jgi:ankyrin repeat protein